MGSGFNKPFHPTNLKRCMHLFTHYALTPVDYGTWELAKGYPHLQIIIPWCGLVSANTKRAYCALLFFLLLELKSWYHLNNKRGQHAWFVLLWNPDNPRWVQRKSSCSSQKLRILLMSHSSHHRGNTPSFRFNARTYQSTELPIKPSHKYTDTHLSSF